MSHFEARLSYSRQRDGRLNSREVLRLRSHMAACPACAAWQGRTERALRSLGLAAEDPAARLAARVLNAVDRPGPEAA